MRPSLSRRSATPPPRQEARSQVHTRRIAIVAFKDAQSIDTLGPLDVFVCATDVVQHLVPEAPQAYAVELLSVDGGPVPLRGGVRVLSQSLADVSDGLDTVLVSGGYGSDEAMRDARLLSWLRAMRPRVRRMGSVCTGAFVLAAAGLLDGLRATTHWLRVEQLARQFPAVQVEPDSIFIRSGDLYTSAGTTAGMDLALALVEEDWGHQVALATARTLVVFLKRPGGQSQFSQPLRAQGAASGPLGGLTEWILNHLTSDLSVESLAARAGMSPRNFARVFTRELGTTPARFVEALRVEQARSRLEEGRESLKEIAYGCGFGSDERMRRAFLRAFRVTPEDYRQRFSRR